MLVGIILVIYAIQGTIVTRIAEVFLMFILVSSIDEIAAAFLIGVEKMMNGIEIQ